jgi:mRNA interferase RelE/StbE
MYRVELSRTALKALENLPKADFQKISKKIDGLQTNPRPQKVEKLSGYDDLYRVRSGDYRIVYQIFDKQLIILVVNVGHRREIYRNL